MATASTLSQPRRRKPVTYGKTSRSIKTWNLESLDAMDEDELSVSKATIEKKVSVKETYPVRKRKTTASKTKASKPLKNETESWDIPSSDDEALSPIKRITPLDVSGGRQVKDLPRDAEPGFAPWEKTKARATRLETGPVLQQSTSTEANSITAARRVGGWKGRGSDPWCTEETPKPKKQVADHVTAVPPAKDVTPEATSAAARLHARRLLAGHPTASDGVASPAVQHAVHKRSRAGKEDVDTTPRKRARVGGETGKASPCTRDKTAVPTCEQHAASTTDGTFEQADIYDVPSTGGDELARDRPNTFKGNARRRKHERGDSATFSLPRKMQSGPALLSDLIVMDVDIPDAASQQSSASAHGRVTTETGLIAAKLTTPEPVTKSHGSLTPRQSELWDSLLPGETRALSPSGLQIQNLSLQSRRSAKPVTSVPKMPMKARSDLVRRRTRLVDRLKASAPSSDESSSEDSDEIEEDRDVDMADATGQDELNQAKIDEQDLQQSQSHGQRQPQSQTSNTGKSGPKITYGRSRSFVPDDNFEEGLMHELQSDITQRPAAVHQRNTAQGNTRPHQSEFDLDDTDDEGKPGHLRTIHELRAVGGNQRFIDDISGSLEDIADHNASARSRRRSALIELAKKLFDKAFAEKFLRQGYEQQLLAECGVVFDEIADFALAVAFDVLLAGDLSEHVIHSMSDGGLLRWLVRMLDHRTDARKLGHDRRNNMSKSAQRHFADFVELLGRQYTIWGELKPAFLSPRTVALKACDCLIGKLRRSADKSELLDAGGIRGLLPTEEDITSIDVDRSPVELALSISALESLSTTALSLAWPRDVVERVRLLLVSPCLGRGKTEHTFFLALRLCLNLTNGNVRNCQVFSKPSTVMSALRTIQKGFSKLGNDVGEQQQNINLDLLVLSMGILINLSEHNDSAREHATSLEAEPLLSSLVNTFQQGQQRLIEAESVEQSITNVAYGYLAVVLANLCRHQKAKTIIASKLPGRNLGALVEALTEFVVHHQKVDAMNFGGEEGKEVWGAFTEQLKGVLIRLTAEAEADSSM